MTIAKLCLSEFRSNRAMLAPYGPRQPVPTPGRKYKIHMGDALK
ncbi:hypothetical protein [Sphingopyxis flava]|nr:hypothetical protein [Sphingopyxis flava]